MTFPVYPGSNPSGYNLTNSLRFRSSASAYLSRTPASAGNRQIWTWSGWVKRGTLNSGTYQHFFQAGSGGARDSFFFDKDVPDTIKWYGGFSYGANYGVRSLAVFRDPSAWYHIIFAADTTQATADNRLKLYVNGVQQTLVSAEASSWLPQNTSMYVNSTVLHTIDSNAGTADFFDGYLAEVNFIDGQALTPSSFGSFNAVTGVWQPARYAGTYGTNGFYLPFQTSNSDNIVIYYPGTLSGSSVINVDGSTNGTKGSGVTSVSGKVGTGLEFDGTVNAYVDTNISTNYTSAFTAAVWFKSTSTSQAILIDKSSYYAENTSAFPFRSTLNASGSVTVTLDAGGDYSPDVSLTSSATGYNDGNWHYFAVVYQGGTSLKIYVDGTEVASTSISISINSVAYNWFLGRASLPYGGGYPGLPFTGTMDSFRLYSRVLSATEISNLYNNVNTQTGIGSDASGNANDWTPINISLTPGVTYDSMTDVPTLTSATAANFCIANPLDKQTDISVTQGNLQISTTAGAGNKQIRGSIALPSSGKFYWETKNTGSVNNFNMGLTTLIASLSTEGAGDMFYNEGGTIGNNGTNTSGYATLALNDTVGVAVDIDANKIYWYKNNTLVNSGGTTINITAPFAPMFGLYDNGNAQSITFGQRPFTYTPPTGFVALNTYNLPTSTIVKGNTVMDATLWTGDGTSPRSITNTAGFQPDLVWAKNRSTSGFWNVLFDSVRGAGNQLSSNETNAELASASSVAGKVSAFNTNGFSLEVGNTSIRSVNGNTETYVGWQWQAGQGTNTTNTSGSITSTVSVNASAGFSVVTYTGTGAAATVGHGLGVAPSLIIVKRRNSTSNWNVYHASVGATGVLLLNLTDTTATTSVAWNNTAPTSSVFTVGTGNDVNASGGTFVAYCFASIAGFSSFANYTGNGSTDGVFVYTGFRPKFVMIKRTNVADDWYINDSVRNPTNVTGLTLLADSSNAEANYSPTIDILSNGFKIRQSGAGYNASGGNYVYTCWAENPFKNALAR